MIFSAVKLGRFLRHRSDFVEIDDTTSYKRLRVQLHGRGIVLRDVVEGIEIKTKRQQVVREGDFVVAEIDAKVGGFGLVPPDLAGGIVSSHYFVFDLDESVCLRGWLEAIVRSGRLQEQVSSRGSTNYAAIRPAHVLDYEIALPPLPEQRRIVARLDFLQSRLAECETLQGEVAKAKESTERACVRKFLDQAEPIRVATLEELLADVRGGGTPSTTDPDAWDRSVPWVTPKDMKSRGSTTP